MSRMPGLIMLATLANTASLHLRTLPDQRDLLALLMA